MTRKHAAALPAILGAASLLLLACAPALAADAPKATAATLSTPRGARLELTADFPPGAGPFPTLVLAPGQGYHMGLPALAQTAKALVAQGLAVYRFNWAYFTQTPRGRPAEDLGAELEDLQTVLRAARAELRVDKARLAVGGKSLGSLVAWKAMAADPALRAGLLLTPVCSHVPQGQAAPVNLIAENYPGLATETRPLALLLGSRDPLCDTRLLYAFAAQAASPLRLGVVGGDHGFEDRVLASADPAAAEAARRLHVEALGQLAASFLTEALRQTALSQPR